MSYIVAITADDGRTVDVDVRSLDLLEHRYGDPTKPLPYPEDIDESIETMTHPVFVVLLINGSRWNGSISIADFDELRLAFREYGREGGVEDAVKDDDQSTSPHDMYLALLTSYDELVDAKGQEEGIGTIRNILQRMYLSAPFAAKRLLPPPPMAYGTDPSPTAHSFNPYDLTAITRLLRSMDQYLRFSVISLGGAGLHVYLHEPGTWNIPASQSTKEKFHGLIAEEFTQQHLNHLQIFDRVPEAALIRLVKDLLSRLAVMDDRSDVQMYKMFTEIYIYMSENERTSVRNWAHEHLLCDEIMSIIGEVEVGSEAVALEVELEDTVGPTAAPVLPPAPPKGLELDCTPEARDDLSMAAEQVNQMLEKLLRGPGDFSWNLGMEGNKITIGVASHQLGTVQLAVHTQVAPFLHPHIHVYVIGGEVDKGSEAPEAHATQVKASDWLDEVEPVVDKSNN